MTFEPYTSAELGMVRKQQIAGWSVEAISRYWRRDREEVDLALWLMLGRWKNITDGRALVNRRLAKRAAYHSLPEEIAA